MGKMLEIVGKYNTAKVFTDKIDEASRNQILELCNREAFKNEKIRIMPDVHSGKGCVVGLTMTYRDVIDPSFVGVDLGCGMHVVRFKMINSNLDLAQVDKAVKEYIPVGREIREKMSNYFIPNYVQSVLENLKFKDFNLDYALRSLGTLGGGNHFVEIDIDDSGKYFYLIVHSGSRGLGAKIANHYIKKSKRTYNKEFILDTITRLKKEGRESTISAEIKKIKETAAEFLNLLSGQDLEDYLHDSEIARRYARLNREVIANEIMRQIPGAVRQGRFHTTHNYIDVRNKIIRKGAINTLESEMVLIPLNMRDGCLLAKGKSNADWNYSAPHGAGRNFSRRKAKETLSIDDFKKEMSGIYSSTISEATLDESAGAYKNATDIVDNITDTVDIISHLKPIYNFKADK